ncbi:MAG: hypothetical protein ACRD16_01695 [Thermoanaerobaculia bacterium]
MNTVQRIRQIPADEGGNAPMRVTTSVRLTPGQIYFLDRFRARVARDSGCRISRAALLQVLVAVASTAPLNLSDIASEDDLTRRLCEAPGHRIDRLSL